jgi:hypothetical protein
MLFARCARRSSGISVFAETCPQQPATLDRRTGAARPRRRQACADPSAGGPECFSPGFLVKTAGRTVIPGGLDGPLPVGLRRPEASWVRTNSQNFWSGGRGIKITCNCFIVEVSTPTAWHQALPRRFGICPVRENRHNERCRTSSS